MHWPSTPVEHRGAFQPPFCPHRECPEHRRTSPGYRFRRHGVYASRKRSRVPRFLCLTCRRTFSRQTFAVSYYRKRPELMRPVAAALVAGSAHRQIARSLECAPTTVTRLAERLELLLQIDAREDGRDQPSALAPSPQTARQALEPAEL